MIDLRTIIGSKIGTAVAVNQLYVPANSLGEHLRKYSEPALMHSEGLGKYHLSKAGSLAKLKLCDRYFALTTHHQLRKCKYEFEQLCILDAGDGKLLTSHRAIFQLDKEKLENDFDCVIFEFTDVVNEKKISSAGWYDLTPEFLEERLPRPELVCTIGYPSHRNDIDYTNFRYPISPNAIWGEQTEPKMNDRLAFKPINPIEYDPEGMSGSPVFGFQIAEGRYKAFFAGLLANASSSMFHFVSRTKITKTLEKLMN